MWARRGRVCGEFITITPRDARLVVRVVILLLRRRRRPFGVLSGVARRALLEALRGAQRTRALEQVLRERL
jgi:hypothetical protein